MNITFSRDTNGNKIVRIKPQFSSGFSIQTLGNLPKTHNMTMDWNFNREVVISEVTEYLKKFGSYRQKEIMGISKKFRSNC